MALIRRSSNFVALALILGATLALASCGGGSSGSKTSTTSGFLAHVNAICADLNRRVAAIPGPIDQRDVVPFTDRVIGLGRLSLRELQAVTPPAAISGRYPGLLTFLQEQLDASLELRAALVAHDRAQLLSAVKTEVASGKLFDSTALELGLPSCAADVEPTRYVGRTAKQQTQARLDEICAPSVAAEIDVRTYEAALADEERQHELTQSQALSKIADQLDSATAHLRTTTGQLQTIHLAGTAQSALTNLIAALRDTTTRFASLATAARHRDKAALASLVSGTAAIEQHVLRSGRALGADACARL